MKIFWEQNFMFLPDELRELLPKDKQCLKNYRE